MPKQSNFHLLLLFYSRDANQGIKERYMRINTTFAYRLLGKVMVQETLTFYEGSILHSWTRDNEVRHPAIDFN